MNENVIGKYIPLDTIIHRLDPRTKIVAVFLLVVAIFVPEKPLVFILIGMLALSGVIISKISFKMILQALRPMAFMMGFLLILNIFTMKTGFVLYTIGTMEIYSDAVFNTLFIVSRLLLMIMITTTLTTTTKPLDLTLGLESLMQPLNKMGFPSHEVAMMISIALRFIPTIIEETMRIMNAQKSRGVDFDEGKINEKIVAIVSLIVPLFSVAFERAYELADAMEARGYVPGADRTRYHVLKYQFKDYAFLFICLLILGLSIVSRFVL